MRTKITEIIYREQAILGAKELKKHEPQAFQKLMDLIEDIKRDPYRGLGKPEPLKHEFSGWWSRRITDEHRLVYRIDGETLLILQCRYHYGKR